MRRHEIARIVEVSSSLFAPVDEAVMAADWVMSLFPRFCFLGAATSPRGFLASPSSKGRLVRGRKSRGLAFRARRLRKFCTKFRKF